MEKLIYELILEVKKLKNSINNIEVKLERIEKGSHVKKGINAITASFKGGYTGEHLIENWKLRCTFTFGLII